jgi:hypothetical protein
VVEVGGDGHSSQDTTVSDLIDQWLELITPDRSPTTARGYRWTIDDPSHHSTPSGVRMAVHSSTHSRSYLIMVGAGAVVLTCCLLLAMCLSHSSLAGRAAALTGTGRQA